MANRSGILIQKTQINLSRPTSVRMWMISSVAILVTLQSSLSDRGASLIIALTALFAALLAEILITGSKDGFSKLKDGSTAASALVFALLLPNHLHPVYAAMGALFAIAVVKYSFGGLGAYWLNPALGGWLFTRFTWPASFSAALEGSPLAAIAASLSSGAVNDTPMNMLGMSGAGSAIDAALTSFFNNTIFLISGAELPSGYIDLLFNRSPGIIADRGILALLVGSIIIGAFRIGYMLVPAMFLGIFGFLTWFAGSLAFDGLFWNGDVLFALLSGGTLAAAFFLAANPSGGAKSKPGLLIIAGLSAILSWLFRFRGFNFYGCFTAIALMNALTPAIHIAESRLFFSYKRKNTGEASV